MEERDPPGTRVGRQRRHVVLALPAQLGHRRPLRRNGAQQNRRDGRQRQHGEAVEVCACLPFTRLASSRTHRPTFALRFHCHSVCLLSLVC